jgi:hypothetical protein
MIHPQRMLLFGFAAMLCATAACSRKAVQAPATPAVARNDNSYIDLQPGWTLRVVVPLLKSGGFRPDLVAHKSEGNTVSLSADDLIGYTTSHYAITGKNGEVRLKFIAAQETRQGTPTPTMTQPPLPFELPRKAEHVRLVYLVRVSQADHNMAIVGSKRLDVLNAFTKNLRENPRICEVRQEIFCSWVPAGIAVRREDQ